MIGEAAFLAYVLGKFWAWRKREGAKKLFDGEQHAAAQAFDRLQRDSDLYTARLRRVAEDQVPGAFFSRVCQRFARATTHLMRGGSEAEKNKLTGVKQSLDAAVTLIRKIDAEIGRRPELMDEKTSWALLAVMGLQGIETLEKWHLIRTPLDDSLRELLHLGPHADGTPELLEYLIDSPITDLLSAPLFLWGVGRMFGNLSAAGDFNEQAKQLRERRDQFDARSRELRAVSAELGSIASEREEAAYQALKMAWLAEYYAAAGRTFSPKFREDFQLAAVNLKRGAERQFVMPETVAA